MSEQQTVLHDQIVSAVKKIFDPEVPVNIYDMGLIYDIDIADDQMVSIRMTLTTPACPVAGILPLQVETAVKSVPGVTGAKVDLVWDPPWNKDMMTDAAKLQLNMDLDPGPSESRDRLYQVRRRN